MTAPTRLDLRRLKRLVRYFIFTNDVTLRMGPRMAQPNVVCWVDSDWADDVETADAKWSTNWKVGKDAGHPWAKQNCTRLELDALKDASQAVLLMEMGVRTSVKILTDPSSAKSTTARRGLGRTKHIQLCMLAVQI